jgi:hypothetical protein
LVEAAVRRLDLSEGPPAVREKRGRAATVALYETLGLGEVLAGAGGRLIRNAWIQALPFPDFDLEFRRMLRTTSEYPPIGATTAEL